MYIKLLLSLLVFLGLGLIPTGSYSKSNLEYEIVFGNKPVGQLSFKIEADQFYQKLNTFIKISGSPLGLRDGTYNMSSTFLKFSQQGNTWFESTKDTLLSSRSTVIESHNNNVIEVKVKPKSEETSLSSNLIKIDNSYNPAQALHKVLQFPCSKEFQVYDGRRLIQIRPAHEKTILKCSYSYQVTRGPGHLPPLYLKNFEISVHRKNKFDKTRKLSNF